jgi:2-hydroxychromene-2-carboxylate isomerase
MPIVQASEKPSWDMYLDLQCPYSRAVWNKLPELRNHFGNDYNITTHLTSLAFHHQSFTAHSAACLIGAQKGKEARLLFEKACFAKQDRYVDTAVEGMTKDEVNAVFATIAEEEGIFNDSTVLTKEDFLVSLMDHKKVVLPTWSEHKQALAVGVFKAPQHVLRGRIVPDTDSSWEIEDYEECFKKL